MNPNQCYHVSKIKSPLEKAILNKNYQKMRVLLKKGEDANERDNCHVTLLMLATRRKDIDAVCILIDFGADPSLLNYRSEGVLEIARTLPYDDIKIKIIKLLEEYIRACENSRNYVNGRPLELEDVARSCPTFHKEFKNLEILTLSSEQSELYPTGQTESNTSKIAAGLYKHPWWLGVVLTLPIVAFGIKKIVSCFMRGSDSLNKSASSLENGNASSTSQLDYFTESENKSISWSMSTQMTETGLEQKEENIYDVPVNHIYAVPIKKTYDDNGRAFSKTNRDDLTAVRISSLSALSAENQEVEKSVFKIKELLDDRESKPFFDEECIAQSVTISRGVCELEKLITVCVSLSKDTYSGNYLKYDQFGNPGDLSETKISLV